MNNNSASVDKISRERISRDLDTNFFVEASAGSGKTSKLVERMIAIVRRNGGDIRKICAITFTKNAANEFYRRFRDELNTQINKTTGLEQENFKEALENIDLCFLGTIDAFCQMIVSEHPMEAGVPSDAAITSNDDMLPIFRAELTKVQKGIYGKELRGMYRRINRMFYDADEKIISQLPYFMNTRDTRHVHDEKLTQNVDVMLEKEIVELRKAFDALEKNMDCISVKTIAAKKAKDSFHTMKRAIDGKWNYNICAVEKSLNLMKGLRLDCDPEKIGVPDGIFKPHGGHYSWYDCTVDDPGHIYGTLKEIIYSCFIEFMEKFSLALEGKLKADGNLTFFDYKKCLRDMLRKDISDGGALTKHIYNRHSYFLLDEFQDTDPMQVELFFYLCAKNPCDNWTKCIPQPGSLFIVGDPKQSIYRFRYADVASYLFVKRLFKSPVGEQLCLYRNFRSTSVMCDCFNKLYSTILPEEDEEDQSRFEAIPEDPDKVSNCGLSGIYSYEGTYDADLEAHSISKLIRTLVNNENAMIHDGKNLRKIDFNDIMVITYKKDNLDTFMRICADDNIPVYVEGSTMFSECRSLGYISAIMGALSKPDDSFLVYNALLCGLFDITDKQLSEYCRIHKRLRLRSYEEEGSKFPEINDTLNILAPLVKLARYASPSSVFESIMDKLPIIEKAGTEHLEYVFYALELIRNEENAGTVKCLEDAAKLLNEMIADEKGIERSMNLKHDENNVHFANLHKVKGLEAPVIILASEKAPKKKKPLTHTEYAAGKGTSYVFEMKVKKFKPHFASTSKFSDKMMQETESLRAEGKRLLYVAGTRAKNLLIIGNAANYSNYSKPAEHGYWDELLTTASNDIYDKIGDNAIAVPDSVKIDADSITEKANSECLLNDRSVQKKSYEIIRPSTIRIKSRQEEESSSFDSKDESVKNKKDGIDPVLLGTMMHKIMENMVLSENNFSADELSEMVLAKYDFDANKKDEYRTLLITATDKIKHGGFLQQNSSSQDILRTLLNADEKYCEVPFCLKQENSIFHGVIDAVYREGNSWHIIDYKTNADPDDLDEKYMGQLNAYIAAFKALTGNDADARTYHIDI